MFINHKSFQKKIIKNEKGAVAVIVAIMMILFLGLVALVVDVGYLYETRRQLQSAADAGSLAGCQEMVVKIKDPNVVTVSQAVAQTYAINKNGAQEATTTVDVVDQSVTVTASRTVDLFFGRIFNLFNKKVSATAKAEVAYLVGVKDMDPLGVPNPKPKEVSVEAIDMATNASAYKGMLAGGNFSGDVFIFNGSIPALPDGKYRIDIISVNNQGNEEAVQGASALIVGANSNLGEVRVDPNIIKADLSSLITISAEVSGNPTKVVAYLPKENGNGSYSLTLNNQGGGLYRASTTVNLSAPYDPGYKSFPITIEVDGQILPQGAAGNYVVVKTPKIEVVDVDLGKNYLASSAPVSIEVKIQGFEYEKLYDLFLDNGTSPGNYYGLDLDYREFAPGTGEPDYPTGGQGNGSGGNTFKEALEGLKHADPWAPSHPYHYYKIGDYVWTKTGAMVGPLDQGVRDRIGSDSCTWSSWRSDTSTHKNKCPHLMTVPLVEETTYEPINGRSKVRIIGFGQFFVENPPDGGALKGRFVEYVKAGVYQKTPPAEPNIKTIRLVKPDGEGP